MRCSTPRRDGGRERGRSGPWRRIGRVERIEIVERQALFTPPFAVAIFQRQPYSERGTGPGPPPPGRRRAPVCFDGLPDKREPEAEAAVAPARAGVAAAEPIERVR